MEMSCFDRAFFVSGLTIFRTGDVGSDVLSLTEQSCLDVNRLSSSEPRRIPKILRSPKIGEFGLEHDVLGEEHLEF